MNQAERIAISGFLQGYAIGKEAGLKNIDVKTIGKDAKTGFQELFKFIKSQFATSGPVSKNLELGMNAIADQVKAGKLSAEEGVKQLKALASETAKKPEFKVGVGAMGAGLVGGGAAGMAAGRASKD